MVSAQTKRRRLAGCICVTALLLTSWTKLAPAATLDEQTCDQLKREIGQLERLGARDNFAKGATWGKANLRAAQLEQVKLLIEMDEAVAFRCAKAKPKPDPALQAKAQAKAKAVPKVATKVQAAEGSVAQDVAKQKPKPKPKPAPVAAEAPKGAPAAAPPKPRPPQQPKAPDAYVPARAPPSQ